MVNKDTITKVAQQLEPLYMVCDDSDRPDNIVSCYPKVEQISDILNLLVELLLPGKFSPTFTDTDRLSNFFDRGLNNVWQLLQPEVVKAIPFRWRSSGRKDALEALSEDQWRPSCS